MRALFFSLLPNYCALCKMQSTISICAACQTDFMLDHCPRCLQCALPLTTPHDQRCGACLKDPPYFDTSLVCSHYAAPLDGLVLGLKFAAKLNYAKIIAQQLEHVIRRKWANPAPPPALLLPVPLSKQRLISRGFNQAVEIARPLSRQLGIPMQTNLLWRTKETLQQSSLHPDERHKNIQGAFTVNPAWLSSLEGQHIAVIDDVMTTGTTLNEVAKVLKRYGAAHVSNLVFARTDRS